MAKKEMEQEVRVERLLQKILTCTPLVIALILIAFTFVVPWLYADELWKIYMKSASMCFAHTGQMVSDYTGSCGSIYLGAFLCYFSIGME